MFWPAELSHLLHRDPDLCGRSREVFDQLARDYAAAEAAREKK